MDSKQNHMEELMSALTEGLSTEDLIYAAIASDIAFQITSKRIDMGLTQADFAKTLGKSQAMISKWESADCNFTLKTLIEIAQKLNLKLQVSLQSKTSCDEQNSFSKVIHFPDLYGSSPSSTWTQESSPDDQLKEM